MNNDYKKNRFYLNYGKRYFDLLFSILALIVLSPLVVLIGFLVRIKLGSPVIYKQIRPGKNEKPFTIYKFRTMTDKKNENGELLSDQERITEFGKFLRSTSLDELPELFNVLKNDMSLVGPRPLLMRYLPYFKEQERNRSFALPGITGLAQINGRNALNWDERFKMDLDYINNISLRGDISIILNSILAVIKREGILVGSEHILKDLDIERETSSFQDRIEIILLSKNELERNRDVIIEMLEDIFQTNFKISNNLRKHANISYENMVKYLKDKTAIIYGAYNGELLIGFLWAYKRKIFDEERIHLDQIIIAKKYRKKGIGKSLLSTLETHCLNEKIDIIDLMITLNNAETLEFYRSIGFNMERSLLVKKIERRITV